MQKKEKVEKYLKLSGYSDEQIEKSISNEQYLDMLYGLVKTYEDGISKIDSNINPVDNYANLDNKKIR